VKQARKIPRLVVKVSNAKPRETNQQYYARMDRLKQRPGKISKRKLPGETNEHYYARMDRLLGPARGTGGRG
jgi:hypothetical protein